MKKIKIKTSTRPDDSTLVPKEETLRQLTDIKRRVDLVTRENLSEHLLVAFNGMPRPSPQGRTEETEVTTGG